MVTDLTTSRQKKLDRQEAIQGFSFIKNYMGQLFQNHLHAKTPFR